METIFEGFREETQRSALMARVSAFMAPVAADAGAVVDDPTALDLADAEAMEAVRSARPAGMSRSPVRRLIVCPAVLDSHVTY